MKSVLEFLREKKQISFLTIALITECTYIKDPLHDLVNNNNPISTLHLEVNKIP